MNQTPLHGEHLESGAVLTDFHGWKMPIRYRSIPEEHLQVRRSGGLFDLCHMGRLEIRGPESTAWLQRVLTNDVEAIPMGRARYTLILNEDGTIIDDALIYRLPELTLLVVNASNRPAVVTWLEEHRRGLDAQLVDRTHDWAMIAIQGPESVAILSEVLSEVLSGVVECPDADWESMKYYSIASANFFGEPAWIARTGYTGEDGFEVYLEAGHAAALWRRTLEVGGDRVAPIGLGARDTLRLEAGMPLYGNDIDDTTDPFEAGLDFAVKLEKGDFVGRDALIRRKKEGPTRRLRGFTVDGRRVARQGMDIRQGERVVGRITSGAPSPTLEVPIAMGYLASELTDTSGGPEELHVDVRGRLEILKPTPLPFFSRTRKTGPKKS